MKSKFLVAVFVLLVLLIASACSSPVAADEAQEADTSSSSQSDTEDEMIKTDDEVAEADGYPEEEPVEDMMEVEEQGESKEISTPADTINLDDPDLFDQPDGVSSYRTSMDYSFEEIDAGSEARVGSGLHGSVHMDGAAQSEPFATTLEFFASGDAVMGASEVYTFTQIADVQYVSITGLGCISSSDGIQENPFEVFLDLGGFLKGEAHRTGTDELVNGVVTVVYEITQDNIDPLDTAGKDVLEVTEGSLNISKDDGSVVRLRFKGTGTNEVLSGSDTVVGLVDYELNYFDYNQPVEIAPPTGCLAFDEVESEYTLPVDASEISQAPGVLNFVTGLTFDEITDFYEQGMANIGCSPGK